MCLDNVFYDRQAQTGAASIAGATLVNAVKTVEYVVEMFVLDSYAVITHLDQNE